MNVSIRRFNRAMHVVLSFLLVAAVMSAQESAPNQPGQKSPLIGQYRPSPQADPTRIVALVPVVDVPGTTNARAPLFLEDRESPLSQAAERVKLDSSKAEVPAGIISFRAMYSDDGKWALVDVQARDALALEHIRTSLDTRVRIFTPDELAGKANAENIVLSPGLSLAQFIEN